MAKTKWEYTCISLVSNGDRTAALQGLGGEGWELVSVVQTNFGLLGYLKRPLGKEDVVMLEPSENLEALKQKYKINSPKSKSTQWPDPPPKNGSYTNKGGKMELYRNGKMYGAQG